jgi:hypothetical protein
MPTITNKNRFVIDVPNLGGGRNTKDSNTLIADTEALDIENFDFEERGALKKVPGSAKLNSTPIVAYPVNTLFEAIKSDGTSHLLAFCGSGIYVSTDGGLTFSTLKDSGLTANKKWSCYTYADNVIMVNGTDTNQIYDFTAVRDMGLTDPTTAPTLGLGAAGNLTGNYYYRVSFVYSGSESNVGVASSVVAPTADKVELTDIPTGGTGCTQRKLYRTKAGGTVYYELATINNNTATIYTDDDVDALLSWKVAPTNNTPPPKAKFVIEKDERLLYILPDSSDFYYSELYKPELSKGTSYRTVGADDGGILMGAAIYEGDMFFYKAKKITDSDGTYYVGHKTYQLSGTDPDPETGDWIISIANNAVGGIAFDTIDYSVSEVLCLDDDGLYSLQRNRLLSTIVVDTISLSNKIEPDFGRFNKYYLHNSSGRVFNHKYYLAVPGEGRTSNSEIHVLDFRAAETKDGYTSAWTKERGFTANCFAVFRNKLIYGTSDGYVCEIDEKYTYFDGAEIQAFFDSKYYDAEIFDQTKWFKILDINIKASAYWSFSVVVYVQKGTEITTHTFTMSNSTSTTSQHPLFGKSLFSRFTFGSGSTTSNLVSTKKVRIKLKYLGELIKLRLEKVYANQSFSIQGFKIHGQYMRLR